MANDTYKRFFLDTIFNTGSNFATNALNLLIKLAILYILSVEDAGLYFYLISISAFMMVFVSTPIISITARLWAMHHKQEETVLSLLIAAVVLITALNVLGAGILALIGQFLKLDSFGLVTLVVAFAFSNSLWLLMSNYLVSKGMFGKNFVFVAASGIVKIALFAGLVIYGATAPDTVILSFSIAYSILGFLLLVRLFWNFRSMLAGIPELFNKGLGIMREHMPYGISNSLEVLRRNMSNWIEALILGLLSTYEAVSSFTTVFSFTKMSTYTPVSSLANVVTVKSLNKLGNNEEYLELIKRLQVFVLYICMPILLAWVMFSEEIFSVFFPKYLEFNTYIPIVAIAVFFAIMTIPLRALLTISGEWKKIARLSLFVVVTNIVLDVILIYSFGFVGAIIAVVLVNSLTYGYLYLLTRDAGIPIFIRYLPSLLLKTLLIVLIAHAAKTAFGYFDVVGIGADIAKVVMIGLFMTLAYASIAMLSLTRICESDRIFVREVENLRESILGKGITIKK